MSFSSYAHRERLRCHKAIAFKRQNAFFPPESKHRTFLASSMSSHISNKYCVVCGMFAKFWFWERMRSLFVCVCPLSKWMEYYIFMFINNFSSYFCSNTRSQLTKTIKHCRCHFDDWVIFAYRDRKWHKSNECGKHVIVYLKDLHSASSLFQSVSPSLYRITFDSTWILLNDCVQFFSPGSHCLCCGMLGLI